MTPTKLFDPTKPVQTRDGRPARILTSSLKSKDETIAAAVTWDGGDEAVHVFYANGKYFLDADDDELDLVNVPETHVRYVNVYPHGPVWGYADRAEADYAASKSRIACVRVEFEEGRFDE